MPNAAELVIDIVAKADQAISAFQKVSKESGSHFSALKVAGVAAAGSVVAELGVASHAAEEHEVTVAKLTQAYKNAGLGTKGVNEGLEEVEASTRRTGQSTEDSIEAYTRLVAATHSTEKAHEELATAQDLAAFKGVSVTTAAKAINMATQGNTRALKEMGIATTDASGKALSQKEILEKLTAAVHGQADAYGDTAAGGMARFHQSMDQMQEKIGSAVLPALKGIINALMPLFNWLGNNQKILSTLVPIIAIAAVVIIGVTKAIQLWRSAQLLLNAALSMNPIGLVILAIAALIAIGIMLYQHWGPFRQIVNDVWGALKSLGSWVENHWQLIVDILLGPVGLILTHLGSVKQVIEDIIGALERIGDAVSKAVGWLGKLNPFKAGGSFLSKLNPFGHAAGPATAAAVAPVQIVIYATPGDDLPEVVYRAMKQYQRRHVRPELAAAFGRY